MASLSAVPRRVLGDITLPILESQYKPVEYPPVIIYVPSPSASPETSSSPSHYRYEEHEDSESDFDPPLPSEAFKEVAKSLEVVMQDVKNLEVDIDIETPSMRRMREAFNLVRACMSHVTQELQEMERRDDDVAPAAMITPPTSIASTSQDARPAQALLPSPLLDPRLERRPPAFHLPTGFGYRNYPSHLDEVADRVVGPVRAAPSYHSRYDPYQHYESDVRAHMGGRRPRLSMMNTQAFGDGYSGGRHRRFVRDPNGVDEEVPAYPRHGWESLEDHTRWLPYRG